MLSRRIWLPGAKLSSGASTSLTFPALGKLSNDLMLDPVRACQPTARRVHIDDTQAYKLGRGDRADDPRNALLDRDRVHRRRDRADRPLHAPTCARLRLTVRARILRDPLRRRDARAVPGRAARVPSDGRACRRERRWRCGAGRGEEACG